MNKATLAIIFGILLIAAYVTGFTIGACTAYAFGVTDGLLLSIIGTFLGGTFAGEFISNAIA